MGALRRWGGVLAAALAAVVYVNALDNPFVYDDRDTVVANPSLANPWNIRFVLVHNPYRPVVNVTYAIDRALWGTGPFGYHLTNVLLHAVVVLLLHALIRRALADARGRTSGSGPAGRPADDWIAFAGAALFAVHPLFSEAVGYISGRSELLCAMFFLAGLLWARAAVAGSTAAGFAAALFAALALLSKEVGLVFPVVALAYDWLVLPGGTAEKRRRTTIVFVPCVVAAGAAAAWRLSAAAGPVSFEAPLLNLWTQAIVIWRYLALLVVPAGQSIMHAVHRVTSATDVRALAAVAGLLLLLVVSVRVRGRQPLVPFGVVFFLAAMAPSSSVVALREGMAEHRVYLASAGVFIAIAGAVALLPAVSTGRRPAPFALAATGAAGLVLASLTVARNEVWGSPVSLWREATSRAPGMWEPHYALADALREAGDCEQALAHYRQVVGMRPQHRDAHTNLGICLAQTQRIDEAEGAFRRALEIDPGFARGYTNLGALALLAGAPDRARDAYQRAIQIDDGNVLARLQLARLYETVFHDFHAAARMCGEARALAPFTPGVVDCVERNQRLAAAKDSRQ